MHGVQAGARVAFMAKEDLAGTEADMIVWENMTDDIGIAIGKQAFQGFHAGDADLMFVADAEVLLQICTATPVDPIKKLRQGIRHGTVLCYFLRPKRELLDMGYEEFVEALGLPLAGCL